MQTTSRQSPPPLWRDPVIVFLLLVEALIATVVVLDASRMQTRVALPPTVVGTWKTNSPRYAGRALVIGARSVTFQSGSDVTDITSHVVRKFEQTEVKTGSLFKVEYVDGAVADATGIIQFIYREGPTPSLVLAHQPDMVWTRVTGGGLTGK